MMLAGAAPCRTPPPPPAGDPPPTPPAPPPVITDWTHVPWNRDQLFEIGPPRHGYRYRESNFRTTYYKDAEGNPLSERPEVVVSETHAPVYQCCRAINPHDHQYVLFLYRTRTESGAPAEWIAGEAPVDSEAPVNNLRWNYFRTVRTDIEDIAKVARAGDPLVWEEWRQGIWKDGNKEWGWCWPASYPSRPRPMLADDDEGHPDAVNAAAGPSRM